MHKNKKPSARFAEKIKIIDASGVGTETVMEELKKMLEEKYPAIDFDSEKSLVTDGILDSIEVVTIISEIEDMFDISVTMEYIAPQYFESVEAMWGMIEELQ